eukprot:XP_001701950.1 predicted protein [Chlamydomonas reinhardtii]
MTPPGGTLALKRNVTVQPTAADGSVKAFVDFRDQPMVIAIAPDVTLQLLELELVNMYGLVGPGLNIIRQSPGGRVALKNCVTIRHAAVVNMRSWPRPVGVPGPQQAVVLPNLTYNSTRSSPKHPMVWNRPGLYLGGFTYSAFNSIYFADVLVDPACLASGRPGDECVAAKLQRLNEEAAAEAQRQQGAWTYADVPMPTQLRLDTIVVAVVVPAAVEFRAAATQQDATSATAVDGMLSQLINADAARPRAPAAAVAVVVQPAEAPRPSDVAEELARMAREVRMQVKDVTIRIDTVLGTGAFGVVYGGIWQGIPVAVKTVIISASQERRKRALHEAALCQSIVHPNIIATYACELQPIGAPVASASSGDGATTDSGRTGLASMMPQIVDWRLYIIQELADGGPLSKLYGRPDIWPAPSAPRMVPVVAMALGIARALAHLHSKRIIHGDLTPNNVMLKQDSSEPSGYTIKVGDFGLSVMLPHNQSHLSNLRMGTMFYMCPAVIFKGQVGPSSDVFSLGVILWELFHGRKAGVMTRCGPRYSSIFPAFPPSCPPAYVSVALNCLQKQSANRPNAELVVQHLEGLLQCLKAGQC